MPDQKIDKITEKVKIKDKILRAIRKFFFKKLLKRQQYSNDKIYPMW